MKTKRLVVTVAAVVVLFCVGYTQGQVQGVWTTFDVPGAAYTIARGIDGSNIVGYYDETGGDVYGAFLYNYESGEWEYPKATSLGAEVTYAHGIDGDNIVGVYKHSAGKDGFLYDGSSWTKLQCPQGDNTSPWDIDGDKIVGTYLLSGMSRGFLYNVATNTWTYGIDHPEAWYTYPQGIEGDKIVGFYFNAAGVHGFLYDYVGGIWETLDADFQNTSKTLACGIDGGNIVGFYKDPNPA